MSGRLIGPNLGTEVLEILRPICAVHSSFRDYFGVLCGDLLNKLCVGE